MRLRVKQVIHCIWMCGLAFLYWVGLTPLSKVVWVCICGSPFRLSTLFWWPLCLFFYWHHTGLITAVCSKSWSQKAWVFQLCSLSPLWHLSYLRGLSVYIFDSTCVTSSFKKPVGVSVGIALNLWMKLGRREVTS